MVGCPPYIKCPSGKYCIATKFTPSKEDIPQTLSLEKRQKSSLNKLKMVNAQRRSEPKELRKPPYKPVYTNISKKIWNSNDLGHIYGYACYPQTQAQKDFIKNNSAYTLAFGVATNECRSTDLEGNPVSGKEEFKNRQNRNVCYSKVIEREIKKGVDPTSTKGFGI